MVSSYNWPGLARTTLIALSYSECSSVKLFGTSPFFHIVYKALIASSLISLFFLRFKRHFYVIYNLNLADSKTLTIDLVKSSNASSIDISLPSLINFSFFPKTLLA